MENIQLPKAAGNPSRFELRKCAGLESLRGLPPTGGVAADGAQQVGEPRHLQGPVGHQRDVKEGNNVILLATSLWKIVLF